MKVKFNISTQKLIIITSIVALILGVTSAIVYYTTGLDFMTDIVPGWISKSINAVMFVIVILFTLAMIISVLVYNIIKLIKRKKK